MARRRLSRLLKQRGIASVEGPLIACLRHVWPWTQASTRSAPDAWAPQLNRGLETPSPGRHDLPQRPGLRQRPRLRCISRNKCHNGPQHLRLTNPHGRRATLEPELHVLQAGRATPNFEGPGPGSDVGAASSREPPTHARRAWFQRRQAHDEPALWLRRGSHVDRPDVSNRFQTQFSAQRAWIFFFMPNGVKMPLSIGQSARVVDATRPLCGFRTINTVVKRSSNRPPLACLEPRTRTDKSLSAFLANNQAPVGSICPRRFLVRFLPGVEDAKEC